MHNHPTMAKIVKTNLAHQTIQHKQSRILKLLNFSNNSGLHRGFLLQLRRTATSPLPLLAAPKTRMLLSVPIRARLMFITA
jgi:hypothetical protein